jgi:hypothetical protein
MCADCPFGKVTAIRDSFSLFKSVYVAAFVAPAAHVPVVYPVRNFFLEGLGTVTSFRSLDNC